MMILSRLFLIASASLFVSIVLATDSRSVEPEEVAVYRSPTCGCCSKWADHLESAGFRVQSHEVPDIHAIKRKYGVPQALSACHTALVGGYVIEGHVPASDIRRLLRERPPIVGLAVPGMPRGSPGMEAPIAESYEVLGFDREGRTSIFSRH